MSAGLATVVCVPALLTPVEIARYARRVADLLGLRDYIVSVDDRSPPAGQIAECVTQDGRAEVLLRFCDSFGFLPPDEQRHAVVHELLHPHFDRPARVVADTAPLIEDAAYAILVAGYRRHVEIAVDTLAAALAPMMPLPDWA
jgi:hypothetical protein